MDTSVDTGNGNGYNIKYIRKSGKIISEQRDGAFALTSKYYYDSNKLVAEQRNDEWIYYIYGVDGIAGFRYNDTTYLYRKNIQGDITHIYTADGEQVAHYAYDAWGNVEELQPESAISKLNPFRYRGYYYDTETGLYYLQTRYYDPETGRFISADGIGNLDLESLGGLNLYAYCENNPVNMLDFDGTKPKWWQWVLFGVGVALVIAAAVVLTVVSYGSAAPAVGLLGAIVIGAAKGALIGAAVGTVVGVAGGAIYAAATGADYGESILSGFLIGFGAGAIIGAVVGGISGGIKYNRAASYLNANGFDVKETLNNFKGIPSVKTSHGTIGYRYYDGVNAFQKGRYLTNALTNNPISDLVLYKNKATMVSKFIISDGSKYLVGRIAGSPVNAIQFFIAKTNWLILIG